MINPALYTTNFDEQRKKEFLNAIKQICWEQYKLYDFVGPFTLPRPS